MITNVLPRFFTDSLKFNYICYSCPWNWIEQQLTFTLSLTSFQ